MAKNEETVKITQKIQITELFSSKKSKDIVLAVNGLCVLTYDGHSDYPIIIAEVGIPTNCCLLFNSLRTEVTVLQCVY